MLGFDFDTFEYSLELLATAFYAISGVRLAAFKKFDWFGAYVIGFITAFGGGTVRDVLLGVDAFWMDDVNGFRAGTPHWCFCSAKERPN